MPRLICLAQAIKRKKASRDATSRTAKKRDKHAQEPQRVYGVLERVPVYLSVHIPIWDVLRKHATHQLIIDQAHPEEALPADVLPAERLTDGALDQLEQALAERRARVLDATRVLAQGKGILAKEYDSIFDSEKEWLAIRAVIASTIPRSSKAKKNRVLLLIRA